MGSQHTTVRLDSVILGSGDGCSNRGGSIGLDVTSAQLLVTDIGFRDSDFRKQLSEIVKSLLSRKVVPIFHENDVVSSLRDSSGIFWDNDSLAALLDLELQADLLVLLSDVDGLYSGPPSDPRSKLIHTYVKEKLEGVITFLGEILGWEEEV
ncbi:Delta-1-pyrroline-5-carboxylate synthase [Orobanche minor]